MKRKVTVVAVAATLGIGTITAVSAASSQRNADCSSGAHTLSHSGDTVYPETGNGGYTSVHTDVSLRYDANNNKFLPGNHVTLTSRATQCLTDFSLDFQANSGGKPNGSNLTVGSVTVNGQPATFAFVQPTYPGDPNGQNDPDPRAHQVSQANPVGGPNHNPLPPACSPELTSANASQRDSLNGTACPANKLVITPSAPVANGDTFTVTVNYTGTPGLHYGADGSAEGWFKTTGGNSMTTEPVGTENWMPLNNHPSVKPTYDFYSTAATGKTALANGQLAGKTTNPADADFPNGSVTWHWHADMPIASYLVVSIIGDYSFDERTTAGIKYYQAQDTHITTTQQKKNKAVMDKHADITAFLSQYSGPYPYPSDGVVAGIPSTPDSVEEMQTMIVFTNGKVDEQTLYHETMHQWWGDNVSEASYTMAFFKEGLASLGEYLMAARKAQDAAGGPGTAAGRAAFQQSLVDQFKDTYSSMGTFWTQAPSKPPAYNLLEDDASYERPGGSYIALRQILGADRFVAALQYIQQTYNGGTLTEPQLEDAFQRYLPNPSPACTARLADFFTQWWDTAYPAGGDPNRPQITGPGLDSPDFYQGGCTATR
ncbi:M1 family metallopeptidase [Actinocrispum wychmicini]|uniref:Peptidase M1-like protein n=1 Tax=Actinocrispum wychmicini TaxID=1213861 RepID=A0A4R2J761_9PSEU|nr:M1 family metallopeptidase [Actinocrispum wychmicini]TCO54354.1 peptidase M1-like protein [Actinocrispum wychmicini]